MNARAEETLVKRAADLISQPFASESEDAISDLLWKRCALGLANFRQEQLVQADENLAKLLDAEDTDLRTIASAFYAMSALKQGDTDLAEARYDKAIQVAGDLAKTELSNPFADTVNTLAARLSVQEMKHVFARQ